MSVTATPEVETPQPQASTIAAAPKRKAKRPQRLPTDHIGQLEDLLEDDPLNLKTWDLYLDAIRRKDKTEQVRETYETFLKQFPFVSKQWVNYIEYELERSEFEKAAELFKRSLIKVSGVALWRCYINYVRRKNNLITGGEEARRAIFKSFDAAIEKVGIDPDSDSLWNEYFEFIDSWKPVAHYDEQQKIDIKRNLFRKALRLPLKNLETLWANYTAFETELNAATSRKFISEMSGAYMNARSWLKEWSTITASIDRSFANYENKQELAHQFGVWMNWINWERANKLELDDEKLNLRVDYVFKQATQRIIFLPQLWFEYIAFMDDAKYYTNQNKFDTLAEGIAVNPLSFLLNFKLIEKLEIENNSALVEKKFQELIEKLEAIHQAKAGEAEEIKERLVKQEIARLNSFSNLGDDEDDDQDQEHDQSIKLNDQAKEILFSKSQELARINQELAKSARIITLTHCELMRSTNRLKGLAGTRLVFAEARKKKTTVTHHLFVENARMEDMNDSTKYAVRVFNLGMKPSWFGNDGEFIFKYLKFLIKTNDSINFNAIFEGTMNSDKFDKIEAKWLVAIFKLYLSYQGNFTINQNNLEKYEKKFFNKFPNYSKATLFADRYTANNDMLSLDDLELGDDSELEDNDNLVRRELLRSEIKPAGSVNRKRKLSNSSSSSGSEVHSFTKRQQFHQTQFNSVNSIDEGFGDEMEADGKDIVTDEIYNVLRMLPKAIYLSNTKNLVNPEKLVELLKSLR
ncbi:hypothetical protein WICPIJ_000260 [Wickerhamomyces pijperi]|uniref:mRNA 3'-end-processing protein RNA14 n=1 Tax=Wickerhamomyces pijperi TaxID=599730 RepID=A0A9P8QE44_WICPI|nr:hypothetical protein WICPIJ_000260 [Wickerhamomyces pijperi]